MQSRLSPATGSGLSFVLLLAATVAASGPPATEKHVVTDTYHGVSVGDEYRWLEDGNDPRVKAWSDAQNAYARSVLDALPGVAPIRSRVTEMYGSSIGYGAITSRGGRFLAMKRQPPKEQAFLVSFDSPNTPASERVVLDPLALDSKGGTSIDWYVPSPDGKRVAVSLSHGGSERGDVHVYETATGTGVAEVVPGVNGGTAGGSLAWTPDGSGFFYTRYPRSGERPAADLDFFTQVYFHALGTPTDRDRYEIGRDFPRIAEIQLDASRDGRFILANVQNGDGGEFSQFLRMPDGRWHQLTHFEDRILFAVFGHDSLYLLSRAGAPRGKILRVPLSATVAPAIASARVVVPESDAVVDFSFAGEDTIVATKSRLYVIDLVGGPNRVRIFDPAGKPFGTLPIPPVSSVWAITPLAGDAVLYNVATFTEPQAWFAFDPGSGSARTAPVKQAISSTSPADLHEFAVTRELAVSKDGTKVPLSMIHAKGLTKDGHNPVLLTGYGGYGVSLGPSFHAARRVWLERGGIIAVANLRGGGEFGEEWHHAGNLTRKQHVFDDFIACAEHLIRARYTSPARLAIEGGSNGGLLMGAAMTQRPELFRAVVSHVGIYDMLRVERSPNGAFNVPEFGTVTDRAQFTAMYAYSPYHHVKDGTRYPPVLFLTGANDPRVDPMHSRKMTARLQAASAGTGTVLLRTSAGSGHGIGTALSEAIEQQTDVYAFLFHELGMRATAPTRAPSDELQ